MSTSLLTQQAQVTELPQSTAPRTPYTRAKKVLGDPTPLACTIVKSAAETVFGGPMPDRLARWVTPEIRFALAEQCGLARRTGVQAREIEIMRIRVCRVNASTAEASLVLKDGDRARAAAIRLEDVSGRWLATALDIG